MALEEVIKFDRLKKEALELCDKCEFCNNSSDVQDKLAEIRDLWHKLSDQGYFDLLEPAWIKKYNELIKLCEKCVEKVPADKQKHCSASPPAEELCKILSRP